MNRIGKKGKNGYRDPTPGFRKFTLLFVALTFWTAGTILDGFQASAAADEFPTVVRTEYGKVEGLVSADNNTLAWKGIPFAKPPVGDLRWKRPEDPDKWGGVKEAFNFGDQCPQYNDQGEITGSEDCLYLNVWRPDSEETDLPVFFFLHGGGNSIGSASSIGDATVNDGSNLSSSGNLIVVSTNYRIGPFGWFTNPVLREGKKGTAMSDSGNYGTLDIIMALKWVKENIEAFGGDPDNVTIAGVSSGACNVYSLLFSPLAAGLFDKAISQSGGPLTNSVENGDVSSDRVIDALMDVDEISRAGMKDNQIADYLRSKTAEEILSVYTPDPYGMLLEDEFRDLFRDDTVINIPGCDDSPDNPELCALRDGNYNKVPIVLGTNAEEDKLFLMPLSIWGGGDLNDCDYQAVAEAYTQIDWGWAVDIVAPLLTLNQPGDVYAYKFLYGTYRYAGEDCEPDSNAFNAWDYPYSVMLGACHTLDQSFFFGNFEWFWGVEDFIFTPENSQGYNLLSDAMMAYVSQFSYTGNPGDAGGVLWTPWENTDSGPRILFDANATELLIEMSTP